MIIAEKYLVNLFTPHTYISSKQLLSLALYTNVFNTFISVSACRPYPCKLCSARFSQPSVLAYHMDSHKAPTFTCHICGRAFQQNYSLKKHVNTHLRLRRFPCSYCTQTYSTAEGLRNHVGRHTGERSYKCGLCPMSFNCTAKSSIHRRKHLVNGEYECERCSFRVKGFTTFKTHLLACHPNRLIL